MLSVNFLERVRKERIVKTRKYRYIWDGEIGIILREPLDDLETTSDWQVVFAYNAHNERWE